MLVLLVGSLHWWSQACFPFEVHAFKWQCELGIPLATLSFVIPAFLYGMVAVTSPWTQGLAATMLASLVANGMNYFEPIFSGSLFTNATATLCYAISPGLLAVLGGHKLRGSVHSSAA